MKSVHKVARNFHVGCGTVWNYVNDIMIKKTKRFNSSTLTDFEMGFLVGFFEGEGYIGIIKYNKGAHSFIPVLQIGNTNRKLLKEVERLIEGKVYSHYVIARNSNPNVKPSFYWRACGIEQVLAILEMLEPYLIGKKRWCLLVKEFCNLRLTREKWKAPISVREQEIFEEIKRLNKRGL